MTNLRLVSGDLEIAARTVFGEARGESYEGKKAVAWVLKNRWLSTRGQFAKDDTLATACLRHRQFSAWNAGDPNLGAMRKTGEWDRSYRDSLRAVLEVIDELTDSLTFGSLWYHAQAVSPDWAVGAKPAARHGTHVFYNELPGE